MRDKVRARFGGRLKAMVSGGAPLNPEIGSFFLALGVQLLQGYGQTEAAPVVCCNPPDRMRIDTVGPPLDGVEVRIAEDGEILVPGDNVMRGYWNDPEATARTLADGWLHTGDIGRLDADGYLRITDRKRDFIKNSGGDMISPARVEGALTLAPEIAQAMVFGDRRPYLVAVVVPDPDFAAAYAGSTVSPATRGAGARRRLSQGVGRGRHPGQPRPRAARAGAPLRHRRRAVQPRQRAADPDPENPPPRDPRRLPGRLRFALRRQGNGGVGYGCRSRASALHSRCATARAEARPRPCWRRREVAVQRCEREQVPQRKLKIGRIVQRQPVCVGEVQRAGPGIRVCLPIGIDIEHCQVAQRGIAKIGIDAAAADCKSQGVATSSRHSVGTSAPSSAILS